MIRYKYTRTQLFSINGEHTITAVSSTLMRRLANLGLRNIPCNCKVKKTKTLRGSTAVTPDIDLINNLQVVDKCISDHKVIVFELPYCKPKLVKRTITCRKKNTDNQAIGTDIQRAADDMKDDYNKNLVDTYDRKLKELLDNHAPLKTRIVTDRPSAPWMTSHIEELKAERREKKESGAQQTCVSTKRFIET
ncbi:ATP-dependent DNA helicase [Elysia marginata]|uniref:ATP-dependent DNA helicase n=1 Tax=Elysia marginata TaxID=1093978 RepID=A0AAV4IJ60_9GAST|nr:ATP-dependent DNA helicase [Elysia marginata]